MKSLVGKIVYAYNPKSVSVSEYIVLSHIQEDPYHAEELGLMPVAFGAMALQYIVVPISGDEAWTLVACSEDDLMLSDILDSISELLNGTTQYTSFEFLAYGFQDARETGELLALVLNAKRGSAHRAELEESVEYFYSTIEALSVAEEAAPVPGPKDDCCPCPDKCCKDTTTLESSLDVAIKRLVDEVLKQLI